MAKFSPKSDSALNVGGKRPKKIQGSNKEREREQEQELYTVRKKVKYFMIPQALNQLILEKFKFCSS